MGIFAVILVVLGLLIVFGSLFAPAEAETNTGPVYPRRWFRWLGGGIAVVGLFILPFTMIYSQPVGQARVIVNYGGTVSHVDTSPGFGTKAPWQKANTWDLLEQTVTYAGNEQGAPQYTDGNVQGREVTVSLARGIQSNVDAALTYSIDADEEKIANLYSRFKNQESFTRQIIQNTILSTMREAPGELTPSQFRGSERDDVENDVQSSLNDAFDRYGVTITQVNLQDIRFTSDVEDSLRAVEVAQQREAEAEANLRATEIEAQAQVVQAEQEAEAAIARAQGQAEANRLLSESLTPQILQQRYIDALKAGTVYVVPEGSTPLVATP